MQIVIPMSGSGERFKKAGYAVPKPLIEIEGKPVIAHIIDMFPEEDNFLFICNQEQLDNPDFHLKATLEKYCPTGKIIGIAPHKLGPVHAVLQAIEYIDKDIPTIVNYCDFTCYWDYRDFKKMVSKTKCDGAIPAYKGFHPHSLAGNYYAFIKNIGDKVLDIQEKQPFTQNPMAEYASSGTYYFATGSLVEKYFKKVQTLQLKVKGEYYVSLVYKPMLDDNLSILTYELEHFMQWGTPEDLQEYRYWSDLFRGLVKNNDHKACHNGSVLIPMAGLGKRFSDEGYHLPKPLIPVSGKAMVEQAVMLLPSTDSYHFVLRKSILNHDLLLTTLNRQFENATVVSLEKETDGQARTCLLGMEGIDLEKPITIGACDNGALYDGKLFNTLMADDTIDVIVWGIRGHPDASRNPKAFGWIETERDTCRIKKISVKTPLENPHHDPIIIGTFTFKRGKDFITAATAMIEDNALVNNEFYVDMAINYAIKAGMACALFEVDHYLGWGTPDDLKCFEYWQSCFNKWESHPYHVTKDKFLFV